eukprot:5916471-Pleurochrysis_carterae.AAC.1
MHRDTPQIHQHIEGEIDSEREIRETVLVCVRFGDDGRNVARPTPWVLSEVSTPLVHLFGCSYSLWPSP